MWSFESCDHMHLKVSTGLESCGPILLRDSTGFEICGCIRHRDSPRHVSLWSDIIQGIYGIRAVASSNGVH